MSWLIRYIEWLAWTNDVIMSLWQILDEETAEFMIRFYELWLGGQPIREAFNNTQRKMAAKYAGEPYKWAAFVLVE